MRNLVMAILMVAPLAGCASSNNLPTLAVSSDQASYRLGVGDELKITVYGEERLSGTFPVNGQGNVSVPLIGEIPAAGKTMSELNALLTRQLGDGLVNNPSVSIQVTNYRPYYILGEVAKPGEYAFSEGLTVLAAAAKAGGFTYRANQKRIYISHKGENSEKPYRLDGGTPVQPGDTIRVSEKVF